MLSEEAKRQENNEIIEHIIAVRAIIEGKCKRCGGGMSGCMGCLFDAFDRGMIPASLDRILDLMSNMPNDKREFVAEVSKRHNERETKWRSIEKENGRLLTHGRRGLDWFRS
jgi:hypothetical protein